MSAKNVLGIIFSNAYDEVLPQLTAFRTMGSIPFASRYRLIDFPLSNMVNAGVPQVGVITKSNFAYGPYRQRQTLGSFKKKRRYDSPSSLRYSRNGYDNGQG